MANFIEMEKKSCIGFSKIFNDNYPKLKKNNMPVKDAQMLLGYMLCGCSVYINKINNELSLNIVYPNWINDSPYTSETIQQIKDCIFTELNFRWEKDKSDTSKFIRSIEEQVNELRNDFKKICVFDITYENNDFEKETEKKEETSLVEYNDELDNLPSEQLKIFRFLLDKAIKELKTSMVVKDEDKKEYYVNIEFPKWLLDNTYPKAITSLIIEEISKVSGEATKNSFKEEVKVISSEIVN